ncbi:MAG: YchJ family protein [Gammaproteobacteria bacterium]|nr:YchJ family protein [Gammaproteobacteria bacterium]
MGDQTCCCGSELPPQACCGPLLDGSARAKTAEALMRSRYSAFVTGNIDYVLSTMLPTLRAEQDIEALESWATNSDWLGLEIRNTVDGGNEDTTGMVEFVARFAIDDEEQTYHERAEFVRQDGTWYYSDGEEIKPQPFTRGEQKVGRNDPCPCGSGKKYKKCCGR